MATTPRATQELIERYQNLVRSIAASVHRKVPRGVDLEDLVGYGQVGLAEAAKEFDPKRGNAFSTYAYYRIRGAMYDGVSKLCWTSRSRYNRLRQDQAADEPQQDHEGAVISHALNTEFPTETVSIDQAADEVDSGSEKTVARYLQACSAGISHSLTATLADPSAHEPSDLAAHEESSRKVRSLVESLPPREAHMIRTVYFEGKTLQEAGRELGISKSWASRLHAKALRQLARSLRLDGAGD